MSKTGQVRISGGRWRNRNLAFPALAGLRPTPDMVRQRVFNWLGQDLNGWQCLDLFAGSGALGFEAASRGATRVWLVERDATVCAALQRSVERLQADQVTICRADALVWLTQEAQGVRFDLILLDPPYATQLQVPVLALLPARLKQNALVYVEHDGSMQLPDDWEIWRAGRTGQSHYALLRHLAG